MQKDRVWFLRGVPERGTYELRKWTRFLGKEAVQVNLGVGGDIEYLGKTPIDQLGNLLHAEFPLHVLIASAHLARSIGEVVEVILALAWALEFAPPVAVVWEWTEHLGVRDQDESQFTEFRRVISLKMEMAATLQDERGEWGFRLQVGDTFSRHHGDDFWRKEI